MTLLCLQSYTFYRGMSSLLIGILQKSPQIGIAGMGEKY